MDKTIEVNDTLTVTAQTVCEPCIWIERDGAGLVKLKPDEVRHLIEALSEAVGVLAEAARPTSGHTIVEARRLRRRRVNRSR